MTPPPDWEARTGSLERRNAELVADIALLRREWAETLDKLQVWFGRQAARKRQQLHRELEEEHKAAEDAPGAMITPGTADKATLRRIAAQRRFGGQQ